MTCISWHPSKRVLAVGWENGELFLYSEQNNTCVEVKLSEDEQDLI